jgi:hypothetical protein
MRWWSRYRQTRSGSPVAATSSSVERAPRSRARRTCSSFVTSRSLARVGRRHRKPPESCRSLPVPGPGRGPGAPIRGCARRTHPTCGFDLPRALHMSSSEREHGPACLVGSFGEVRARPVGLSACSFGVGVTRAPARRDLRHASQPVATALRTPHRAGSGEVSLSVSAGAPGEAGCGPQDRASSWRRRPRSAWWLGQAVSGAAVRARTGPRREVSCSTADPGTRSGIRATLHDGPLRSGRRMRRSGQLAH